MMRKLAGLSDAALGLGLAVTGMIGLAIGFSTTAHPFTISPSIDGTLMCAQFGFVLATLHGLSYRRSLGVMIPVVAVLGVAAVRQHESVYALVGVTLTLYGVVGIIRSLLVNDGGKKTRARIAPHPQKVRFAEPFSATQGGDEYVPS